MDRRNPRRQDTFDLRDQIVTDDHHQHPQPHQQQQMASSGAGDNYPSDEEHSVLEDDSEEGEHEEYLDDDDRSSSLSIPNESIDFDLVYSLHSFAATVEGQASVVKGDSLVLMDDSNSYWWLVRVLKTQEIGYIPAENIETPFERLARLNKHRNVDLASATQAEMQNGLQESRDHFRNNMSSRQGSNRQSPSPIPPPSSSHPSHPSNSRSQHQGGQQQQHQPKPRRSVIFTPALHVHRYPPAVWGSEEDMLEDEGSDVEWDDEGYEDEDLSLAEDYGYGYGRTGAGTGIGEGVVGKGIGEEMMMMGQMGGMGQIGAGGGMGPGGMEPDDGMSWEDGAAEEQRVLEEQRREREREAEVGRMRAVQRQQAEETQLRQQQQQQQQQQMLAQQEQQQRDLDEKARLAAVNAAVVAAAGSSGSGGSISLRKSPSRERVADSSTSSHSISPNGRPPLDPAEVMDTRKVSVTPNIAREDAIVTEPRNVSPKSNGSAPGNGGVGGSAPGSGAGPMLPSAVMQKQEEDRKRTREEIEALEVEARKRAKANVGQGPVSSASLAKSQAQSQAASAGGKLRKLAPESGDEDGSKKEDKKSRGGLFGGLFGRKKDKDKNKEKSVSSSSAETGLMDIGRSSEESGRSGSMQHGQNSDSSPTTNMARQQQQQQMQMQMQARSSPGTPPQAGQGQDQAARSMQQSPVSQHAVSLRQRDQQQQALYQQYLNRSPSSPPEAQPSFGLQSAPVVQSSMSFGSMSSSNTGLTVPSEGRRPRPGSLVLQNAMEGQGVGVPELSVIRVFAGKKLQTEATFKTVLLNSSTTSADLVRQAIQRFRLPAGEDANDYYLTVKQLEGSSAVLKDEEQPLQVFETLVEAALELPKVKRSSVGSISSIASNLSMHPAIKKLPMNDFTDDSAVKFYLNRRGADDSMGTEDGEDTLMAQTLDGDHEDGLSPKGQYLNLPGNGNVSGVPPERFMSPSSRFALKLVIYPEDLPDDMVFDPLTEAIVFKNTLRERGGSAGASSSGGINQAYRRKVFVFPKNITVAEVIEIGLDRFGIVEGVVDGGDEVEDKLSKRRSSQRVRYALNINVDGREEDRELSPSSRVIDAYPRAPTYRAVDKRFSDTKRRSIDSAQLLGSPEDVPADDPTFILRRATTYRASSSRHRLSAPLDEIALQKMHMQRDSTSSSIASDATVEEPKQQRHLSKQELIAAQRAATRANQRAILSAQTNSLRGVDVLLPGNAGLIRSSRYETEDRMRYSYVEPDGETFDISQIVEEEWQNMGGQEKESAGRSDLLEGVLSRNKEGFSENLDRFLSKIKGAKEAGVPPPGSAASTDSAYTNSDDDEQAPGQTTPRSGTPTGPGRSPTSMSHESSMMSDTPRVTSPISDSGLSRNTTSTNHDPRRARSATPNSTTSTVRGGMPHGRAPSFTSVVSDMSGYRTAIGSPMPSSQPLPTRSTSTPKPHRPRPVIPKDDFGVSNMMAIIEYAGTRGRAEPLPAMDPVDELLFGREFDLGTLHPDVREIYGETFRGLEEMDKALDDLLTDAIRA